MESIKKFEILMCSREVMKNKIPAKNDDESTLKTCEEALNLRKDLDELESIREKIGNIIENIFSTFSEDNLVSQFLQVIQKKLTEKGVLIFFNIE